MFFAYEKALKEAAALDFDDLLTKTVELLQNSPEIRQKWQRQFEYILIDEYQDTNAVQYALIKLLVNERRNRRKKTGALPCREDRPQVRPVLFSPFLVYHNVPSH